ncbi:MAG: asparagine--tRNA ligase [Anaerolineales bacterium]|nr:asparagine--tRNA ligase [Anaerolineales bacterium]
MSINIKINNADAYVGQDVTLTGWVQKRIDKGRLQFVHLRDGTGVMQCVVFKKNLPEDQFDAARHITLESAVSISGALRAEERAPGGFELDANAFAVISRAEDPYPLAPKRDGGEHGSDFLLNNRHLWLRDPRQTAILRTRATLVGAIRNWLDDQGFVLVDTPIITPAAAEGTTNLFATEYFEEPAYLAQTGQLYSEATIGAFGRVYCFGPTFRAEKSDTRRHAMEFWMVEPEMAFTELDENMEVIEQFVSHCVQTVLRERAADLAALERDTTRLQNVLPPFPRIHYDDAVKLLHANGYPDFPWGEDFGAPHEDAISAQFDKPVFVHHYPRGVKAFYMQPDPERPDTVLACDLIAPEGYGEIVGGSQRMHDYQTLLDAIDAHKLPQEAYEWYLDLRKYGAQPHSGFGMGLERVLMWLCGLPHIREALPFPRLYRRFYP